MASLSLVMFVVDKFGRVNFQSGRYLPFPVVDIGFVNKVANARNSVQVPTLLKLQPELLPHGGDYGWQSCGWLVVVYMALW